VPPKVLLDGLCIFPAEDVMPGTRWAEVTNVPWGEDGEALKVTSAFVFVGEQTIEQQIFDRIDVKLEFEVQPRTDGQERLTIERQSGSGTIDFDSAAGHLIRSELQQDLAIHLQPAKVPVVANAAAGAEANPPAAGSEPVRAEISTRVNVRFQEVEPQEPKIGAAAAQPL
jgi:hypothetical protein